MDTFRYQRLYQGPLQAIVLDWAGTTMDYGCFSPVFVFDEVFKQHGVEVTEDEIRTPMGAHKKVHLHRLLNLPSVAERWERTHGNRPTNRDVDRMFDEFLPFMLDNLVKFCDLIPGCVETVDACRERGLKVGSTTGFTTEMMAIVQVEAKKRGNRSRLSR